MDAVGTRSAFLNSLTIGSTDEVSEVPRDSGIDSQNHTPADSLSRSTSTDPLSESLASVTKDYPQSRSPGQKRKLSRIVGPSSINSQHSSLHPTTSTKERLHKHPHVGPNRTDISPFPPFPDDATPSFVDTILPGAAFVEIHTPSPQHRPSQEVNPNISVFCQSFLAAQPHHPPSHPDATPPQPSAFQKLVSNSHKSVQESPQRFGIKNVLKMCVDSDLNYLEQVHKLNLNPLDCSDGLYNYMGKITVGPLIATADLVVNTVVLAEATIMGSIVLASSPLMLIPELHNNLFGEVFQEAASFSASLLSDSTKETIDAALRIVPIAGPFLSYGTKWVTSAVSKLC